MGLFDTVYVCGDIAATWDLHCGSCGVASPAESAWQTKSLDPCMYNYYLRHAERGEIRLFLLDRPHEKRFWRAWTPDEILESESLASERAGLFVHQIKRPGEGTFLPEAFLPHNRGQRAMGELPHQWVEICRTCSCGASIERWIKFCDGVALENRQERPQHAPGFFDHSGGFGE